MDSLEKLLLAAFKQLFQAERVELISLHQLHQEQNLPPGQLYALADNGKHVGCALILRGQPAYTVPQIAPGAYQGIY